MKHMLQRIALCSLLAVLAGAWSFAEETYQDGTFEVSPYVGWNFPDQNRDPDALSGARFGYFFTDNWSVEFDANVSTGFEDTDNDVEIQNYLFCGLYNWHLSDKWIPYAKLGAGWMKYDPFGLPDDFGGAVAGGGGIRYMFRSKWGLRAEGLYVSGGEADTGQVSAGLTFGFGGRRAEEPAPAPPAPKPTPVQPAPVPDEDTDRDGVVDRLDKCPGTPRGAKVDSDGCPMDGDRDGVLDGLDKCPDSTPNAKVDAVGCEKVEAAKEAIRIGETIVLEDLYFDTNMSNIDATDSQILDRMVKILKDNPAIFIAVSGHTDSQGSDAYNKGLSERRAKSVLDYFVQRGIDASRVTSAGYGETQPRDTNDTSAGRTKNRRVEVTRTK